MTFLCYNCCATQNRISLRANGLSLGRGIIAYEAKGNRGRWHDKFYIPEGETRTLSELRELDYEYEASFWGNAKDEFAKWYVANKLK